MICNQYGNIVIRYADLKKINSTGISDSSKILIGIGAGVGTCMLLLSFLFAGS